MSPQGQSILVQIRLQIGVITSFFHVFCSVFFKWDSPGHLQNGIFCKWAGLFIILARHLPTIYSLWCDSSHIFKILPNVRSTINGTKTDTNL